MKTFFAHHKYIFVAACMIAIIYGFHHIAISSHLHRENQEYHPILVNEDETLFTAPKAQAAFLGNYIVGDFNTFEHRDELPYVLPFLNPFLMGMLARLTGSVEHAFIVGDFLFPPIIFLLFYFLLFEIIPYRMISAASSILFLFVPKFFAFFPPLLRYLQASFITFFLKEKTLYFSRIEDPQITVPLYLIAFYFLFRTISRRERMTPFIAGIAYGLLFYSYLYHWVYFSLGIIILLILLIIKKNYAAAQRVGYTIGIGLFLSLFHWINTYRLIKTPLWHEFFMRQGPEIGRALSHATLPLFAYFLHAILLIILLCFFWKKQPIVSPFITAFLIPIYAVYNLQVITGFNIHPDHWIKATLVPLGIAWTVIAVWIVRDYHTLFTKQYAAVIGSAFAGFLIAKALFTENPFIYFLSVVIFLIATAAVILIWLSKKYFRLSNYTLGSLIAILAITIFFTKGILTNYTFVALYQNTTLPQNEVASYQWLNEHTPKYSVIATPSFTTNSRLQLYTHNRLFLPNGYNTYALENELWDRFLLTNQLFHIAPPVFAASLDGSSTLAGGKETGTPTGLYPLFKPDFDDLPVYYLFHMRYLKDTTPGASFKSEVSVSFPDAVKKEKMREYALRLKTALPTIPYRLDYLYYGPREQRRGPNPALFLPLRKIYDENGIQIYAYGINQRKN